VQEYCFKQAYNQAAPVVKDVTDTAAPYVKKGLETAGEVAAPVVKAAEPVVKVTIHTISFLFLKGRHTPWLQRPTA
jgi:hypothetical protein